jgi:hypothetical protein
MRGEARAATAASRVIAPASTNCRASARGRTRTRLARTAGGPALAVGPAAERWGPGCARGEERVAGEGRGDTCLRTRAGIRLWRARPGCLCPGRSRGGRRPKAFHGCPYGTEAEGTNSAGGPAPAVLASLSDVAQTSGPRRLPGLRGRLKRLARCRGVRLIPNASGPRRMGFVTPRREGCRSGKGS